jgi:Amt family ammonium transporter
MSPGLAFFEAGMLRSKNTLSLIVQIFSGLIILSLMWFSFGFSLTYGDSQGGIIGSFQYAFFIDVDYSNCISFAPHVPAAAFAMFQMMFAVITPLLMTGAYAERMKFKIFLLFTILWEIFVYYPIAHWVN